MSLKVNKKKRNKQIEELIGVKESYLNKRQPIPLFISFVVKNFALSVTNWLFILVFPLAIFAATIYIYPFYDIYATFLIYPAIIIGVVIFSRAIYRYHQQSFFLKKYSNYAIITGFYFLLSMVWSFVMFGLFLVVSVGFWKNGAPIKTNGDGTNTLSPALLIGTPDSPSYLENMNWLGLLYLYFQTTVVSMAIGCAIGMLCFHKTSLWVFILIVLGIIFGGSILVSPGIYNDLSSDLKTTALFFPLTPSFNLSLEVFSGKQGDIPGAAGNFEIKGMFNPFLIQLQENPTTHFVTNGNSFRIYSRFIEGVIEYFPNQNAQYFILIMDYVYAFIAVNVTTIRSFYNVPLHSNYNPNNELYMTINEKINRWSSLKSIFIGVPESFKLDGMDTPYKNYIIYVEHPSHNKYAVDLLTNRVRLFKRNTIQYKNFLALKEIQYIFFNDALFTGIKVRDFIEYYKRIDFVKYQEIIGNFNFERLLNIKMEYLDYDSLFYLYIFAMLFKGKRIFLIDNYSLSKISSKVIDIVQKCNMNYWLITNIK